MKKMLFFLALAPLIGSAFAQGSKSRTEDERLGQAATVMREILGMPEGIPQNLLDRATCVLVYPGVKKGAFVFGGSYGRGAITCRTGRNFSGPWSAPAMFALEGFSFGLQAGGQATDFVLLVMNEGGAQSVMSSKVKLGADASIAAGPVGRAASAETDVVMRAQILSYSRSRGIFAGLSLAGSTMRSDGGANRNLYGKDLSATQIVREGAVKPTKSGRELIAVLTKASPNRKS
ncbi:MAG TPA: lipid-binding SYLF domain-containing protein [Terriglobales bacterium]|nr:lipid-binding SYLF domain-containing protein [Terriglobales bacterium]